MRDKIFGERVLGRGTVPSVSGTDCVHYGRLVHSDFLDELELIRVLENELRYGSMHEEDRRIERLRYLDALSKMFLARMKVMEAFFEDARTEMTEVENYLNGQLRNGLYKE